MTLASIILGDPDIGRDKVLLKIMFSLICGLTLQAHLEMKMPNSVDLS